MSRARKAQQSWASLPAVIYFPFYIHHHHHYCIRLPIHYCTILIYWYLLSPLYKVRSITYPWWSSGPLRLIWTVRLGLNPVHRMKMVRRRRGMIHGLLVQPRTSGFPVSYSPLCRLFNTPLFGKATMRVLLLLQLLALGEVVVRQYRRRIILYDMIPILYLHVFDRLSWCVWINGSVP